MTAGDPSLELPRALRPWASLLADLPGPAATVIGAWLPALERLLGPYLVPRPSPGGPPDGFGALARRGPYERLLLSEWMLWQEAPEEFLRRATSGEHLFHALVRKQPAGRRRRVVLFDVGPAQIGAPRLAQIALLGVLVRRAAVAGTSLAWGALQHPAVGLIDGLGARELTRFLALRTDGAPEDADWESWRAALAAADDDDTELWTVGGPGLRRPGRHFHVEVREPDGPGEDALSVRVVAGAGASSSASSSVSLPLPPASRQVAVLRGFDQPGAGGGARSAPAAPVELLDARAVAFAGWGRRLFVLRDRQTIDVWPVPSLGAASAVRPPRRIRLRASQRFVAAGWQKKRFIVVSAEGEDLFIEWGNSRRSASEERLPGAAVSTGTVDLMNLAWLEPNLGGVWFIDGTRTLVRVDGDRMREAVRVDTGVRVAVECAGGIAYLCEESGGRTSIVTRGWSGTAGRVNVPPGIGGPVFAAPVPQGRGAQALFAYRVRPFVWRLSDGQQPHQELHLSPGVEVAGVAWLAGGPALLVREADERTLTLVSRQRSQTVHVAPAPILHAAIHPLGNEVVVVTEASVVVVDRLGHVLLELSRATADRGGWPS